MKSARPKVLHEIAGLPMLGHVMKAANGAGSDAIAVVVGGNAEAVNVMLTKATYRAQLFSQKKRLGTANAVLAAKEAIEKGYDDLLVLFGDTPLVRPETLNLARRKLIEGNDIAVIGFQTANPAGYGRLILEDGVLVAIREERDCSANERAITFCNGGLMAISGGKALSLLEKIKNDNAKSEYYLTDIVGIAHGEGLRVTAVQAPFEELLGINNRAELAEAEQIWQANRRRKMMMAGVTLQSPETVFFSHDTELGQDCVVEPHVWFGPGVKIGNAARIRAFSHLEGTVIAENAQIGPFARLRPGAKLGKGSKVGNFCEVKQAVIGDNAKINHLSYIGDSKVGPGANIGAGTITCNYDGFNKFMTEIGEGAFVGSNSALVAPVKIGKDAIIAAGSVITKNVPDEALAFGRARQTVMEGRAKALNALNAAKKKTTLDRSDK